MKQAADRSDGAEASLRAEAEGLTHVRSIGAEAALSAAKAEGLTLVRSEAASAGYKNVYYTPGRPNHPNANNPYSARINMNGRQERIGAYGTPEEAALAVARFCKDDADATLRPKDDADATLQPVLRPPQLTAEEAVAQAEEEGLVLMRSAKSATGFTYVSRCGGCREKPFKAQIYSKGGQFFGYFATAEEAALRIVRALAVQAAEAPSPPAGPAEGEEALRQAEAEGLTLRVSKHNSISGFAHVKLTPKCGKPYNAHVMRDGVKVTIGSFETPEGAALCFARSPEGRAAAVDLYRPLTAEEALRQAEDEGLGTVMTLLRRVPGTSDGGGINSTGFKHVSHNSSFHERPFVASVTRNGKKAHIGFFATVEEAALGVARSPEGRATAMAAAAAAAAPPMTAKEALRLAEAEGLTLLRSGNVTGYKRVQMAPGSKPRKKPYTVEVRRDRKRFFLGQFATAEEAALVHARTPEGRAMVAAAMAGGRWQGDLESSQQPALTVGDGDGGSEGDGSAVDDDDEEGEEEEGEEAEEEEEPMPPTPPTPTPMMPASRGGTGKRKRMPERFEELEECRERGFVTEEEYKQKRAEIMKCF